MKVGWIGIGVMGRHMAGHLISAGHQLAVFSRTASKCEPLVARGATLARTPREAAEGADVVFTMVGRPDDVEAVTLGDDGALSGMPPGSILVDHTTSTPRLAVHIAAWAAAQGVLSLDAPVSGGDIGAEAASLSIMCGGPPTAVERAMPLLELMGKNVLHLGPPGAGQHTKMCNQILACGNMIGMTEALIYAHRAGLDAEDVIRAIGAGAAGSWAVSNLGPRVVKRDFAPGFMIEHMSKDLGIALSEAERMGLNLPGLALAHQLYASLLRHGHGKDGTQALTLALEDTAKYKSL
eukprot:CAMPEP_0119380134 /NCGR_PEP_ID=MMETSP1334-20130426/55664_1 /TAXON_ID=127549 /ORGANISM="Calcidiscus leptoporus, Strain RCC1130" /LENGTH=293 /DNA_ID=CAMNT_0007399859 /DNA_START=19 /DNA_END=900 /DNA_ORIENTATION=+